MTSTGDMFFELSNVLHDLYVTATLKRDVQAIDHIPDGRGNFISRNRVIPAGTRIRVVMASRFGDVGITDDLNATGYCARVGSWESDENVRNPGDVEQLFDDITGMPA